MAGRRPRTVIASIVVAVLVGSALVFFLLGPRPARPAGPVFADDTTGVFNILVIGRDARALRPSQDSGTGRVEREKVAHSDIVIVAHFNLPRRIVNLVALPRDLLVEVPGMTRASSPTDFTRMDKLTHTHALGGEPLLRRTVEHLLGISVRRYVAFDFDSFRMVFDLLRPMLGRLRVQDSVLADRDQALKFARRRNGLRYDDLDRCRNAVALVRAVAIGTWRFAGTRAGDELLRRLLAIVGEDTDLTLDEVRRLQDKLRAAGFRPAAIQGAVLVSEGRPVTLRRYELTLSCYLPIYDEIEKQRRRFLLDSLDVAALDFMTQQEYRWPGYMTVDYDSIAPPDTALLLAPAIMGMDSARIAYRLQRLQQELRVLDSINAAYDAVPDSTSRKKTGN